MRPKDLQEQWRGGKVYFGSHFQRSQSTGSWLYCTGPKVSQTTMIEGCGGRRQVMATKCVGRGTGRRRTHEWVGFLSTRIKYKPLKHTPTDLPSAATPYLSPVTIQLIHIGGLSYWLGYTSLISIILPLNVLTLSHTRVFGEHLISKPYDFLRPMMASGFYDQLPKLTVPVSSCSQLLKHLDIFNIWSNRRHVLNFYLILSRNLEM